MGLYVESTQNKTDLLYIITTQLEQSLKINNVATYALWWISPVKGSEFFVGNYLKKHTKQTDLLHVITTLLQQSLKINNMVKCA